MSDLTAAIRQQQSSIIVTIQYALAGTLCLVLVGIAFTERAMPEAKRLALVNQENVPWAK
jgi:hypothetical protein